MPNPESATYTIESLFWFTAISTRYLSGRPPVISTNEFPPSTVKKIADEGTYDTSLPDIDDID